MLLKKFNHFELWALYILDASNYGSSRDNNPFFMGFEDTTDSFLLKGYGLENWEVCMEGALPEGDLFDISETCWVN